MALDTGLRACGFAVVDDGTLVFAELVRSPEAFARGPRAWATMVEAVLEAYPLAADLLVVEMPQYDGRTSVGGVAPDVFEVVGVAGRLLAAFTGRAQVAWSVTPQEWKKNLPKPVHHARLAEELSPEEALLVPDDHNVRDAVALALWAAKERGERRPPEIWRPA